MLTGRSHKGPIRFSTQSCMHDEVVNLICSTIHHPARCALAKHCSLKQKKPNVFLVFAQKRRSPLIQFAICFFLSVGRGERKGFNKECGSILYHPTSALNAVVLHDWNMQNTAAITRLYLISRPTSAGINQTHDKKPSFIKNYPVLYLM